jgi:hypothetical protein
MLDGGRALPVVRVVAHQATEEVMEEFEDEVEDTEDSTEDDDWWPCEIWV